jgi:hypothetical protein
MEKSGEELDAQQFFGKLNLTSRSKGLQVMQYEITINTIDQFILGSTESHSPSLLICSKLTRCTGRVLLRRLCKRYDTALLTNERPGGNERE